MNMLFQVAIFCLSLCYTVKGLDPIIVRGNKMYNSKSGERFVMKGLTYGYNVDDDTFDKYAKSIFDKQLESFQGVYNTIRIYNINPDLSYEKFMKYMESIGVYVLLGASPANDPYFGQYRYSTMRKDLGPTGSIITDSEGKKKLDQGLSCYPAKLLEYGKQIAKNFAKYDNTLGFVIANEILQKSLKAAACVKQYVADLKNWMRINGRKMRIIPLSFAMADSAYEEGGLDADAYGAVKLQGLLCNDVRNDGSMYQSIDILLLNAYRWCDDGTFDRVYRRIVNWTSGAPIVIAMGEFGCKSSKSSVRTFEMIPYLVGSNSANGQMHEIFSGGTAYSYGNARQGEASNFPLFEGGSQDPSRQPSQTKTPDYDNLVKQFKDAKVPEESADWNSKMRCRWTPTIKTSVGATNTEILKNGWLTSCRNVVIGSGESWITTTRNGAVCTSGGAPCEVNVPSKIGTTEVSLCGFVDEVSGGTACEVDLDCGLHGKCSDGTCSCIGCYSGSSCDVFDASKCTTISSTDGIGPFVFGAVGTIIAISIGIMLTLHGRAQKSKKAITKQDKQQRLLASNPGSSSNDRGWYRKVKYSRRAPNVRSGTTRTIPNYR